LRTATIRLDRVSFRYPSRSAPALDRVDLELAPGETVALVGPSGSGKSTLASLLLRLADPSEGRIVVGDTHVARCSPEAWRLQVAWVPQRPTLLRGSVRDNIRLGRQDACEREVRSAAALAGADGFVRDLPDGYDTVVG